MLKSISSSFGRKLSPFELSAADLSSCVEATGFDTFVAESSIFRASDLSAAMQASLFPASGRTSSVERAPWISFVLSRLRCLRLSTFELLLEGGGRIHPRRVSRFRVEPGL